MFIVEVMLIQVAFSKVKSVLKTTYTYCVRHIPQGGHMRQVLRYMICTEVGFSCGNFLGLFHHIDTGENLELIDQSFNQSEVSTNVNMMR